MQQHSIVLLVQKMEVSYAKEIQKYLALSKKQRTEKLYKLIATAKNEEQLQKELLFKKLFGKSYSDKGDYLWRNEIRLLKEELEKFVIQTEHENISKNNEAYNNWLLIHAYDRLKFSDGMDEIYNTLISEKDDFASYNFVLDACMLQLNNLHYKISDLAKRMNQYPELIQQSTQVLNDMISTYCAKLNQFKMYHNWLAYSHNNEYHESLFLDEYHLQLIKNPISNFYNNYAQSITITSDPNAFTKQLNFLNEAIEIIKPLSEKNKLLKEAQFQAIMAKGRELSANGFFLEAHEILSSIRQEAQLMNVHFRTVFYVNFITNLVKCKFYKEALFILENEFTNENPLYKNMLLYNKLICYLYLRDTENLNKYISYDLDAAPFPQNYMLKVIKSAYFYLIKEFDTALSIINSLLQGKSSDNMLYYKPISNSYKLLYSLAAKNCLLKKWSISDCEKIKKSIQEFDKTSTVEFRNVSVFLWLKDETSKILHQNCVELN